MKLLYIFSKMHNYGGMERILTAKMNYLSEINNYNVHFITYEQQDYPLPFKLSSRINYLSINACVADRSNLTFLPWLYSYYFTRKVLKSKLKFALKIIKPDIIFVSSYSFNILDIIIELCKKLSIKIVLESHVEPSTILMSYKYKYNPILYWCIKKWDNYILKIVKNCNAIVSLTHNDALFWRKFSNKVHIIPNMLTVIPYKKVDYLSKRIISVGRYTYQKGFDRLIKIWKQIVTEHSDWELYIYGSGDRTEYIKMVMENGLCEYVHCMPPSENIAEEYANSSIYCMCSRYEGFGLVLIEAMNCGLPCISYNCPYGPSEIINNENDGFLIDEDDEKQFINKLKLLMSDLNLRKKMGYAAKNNVIRYSQKNIMDQWIELMEKL